MTTAGQPVVVITVTAAGPLGQMVFTYSVAGGAATTVATTTPSLNGNFIFGVPGTGLTLVFAPAIYVLASTYTSLGGQIVLGSGAVNAVTQSVAVANQGQATDYGTDVQALTDLPDPELLCSGDLNVAYALARRLTTPPGALEEIGETEPYDSIDVRAWLGKRVNRAELDDLRAQATQVLLEDERVDSVAVDTNFLAGTLTTKVQGTGKQGPFDFVLSVNAVTAQLLRGA